MIAAGDTYAVKLPGGGFGIVRVVRDHSRSTKFCAYYGVERCYTIVPSHRVFNERPAISEIDPATLYLARIATNRKPELRLSTALVSVDPPRTFEPLGNLAPTADEAVAFAGTLGRWSDVLLQWKGEGRLLYERARATRTRTRSDPPARPRRRAARRS